MNCIAANKIVPSAGAAYFHHSACEDSDSALEAFLVGGALQAAAFGRQPGAESIFHPHQSLCFAERAHAVSRLAHRASSPQQHRMGIPKIFTHERIAPSLLHSRLAQETVADLSQLCGLRSRNLRWTRSRRCHVISIITHSPLLPLSSLLCSASPLPPKRNLLQGFVL